MPEITTADQFGQAISRVIKEHRYKRNLEIGSWDGLGSTQCFIEGMKDLEGPKELICLEIEEARFRELRTNTHKYPWVKHWNISSIGRSQMIPKSFSEVWDSPHNNHTRGRCEYPRELVEKWYNDDIPRLPEKGYLKGFEKIDLLGAYDNGADIWKSYDAVLIDGCEFTGYSEFALLRDRTDCFFLDDVFHAYKCAQIYNELISDPEWALEEQGPDLRNGFAIFIRR